MIHSIFENSFIISKCVCMCVHTYIYVWHAHMSVGILRGQRHLMSLMLLGGLELLSIGAGH